MISGKALPVNKDNTVTVKLAPAKPVYWSAAEKRAGYFEFALYYIQDNKPYREKHL